MERASFSPNFDRPVGFAALDAATPACTITAMEVVVREPRTPQDFELYYDLRWRILREPWGQSRESARDEHEGDAVHLMAWSGSNLVGVGRAHHIQPDVAQIRFMAVEPSFAGQGVGGRILEQLETRLRRAGVRRVVLNAREAAVPFYQRHGYRIMQESGPLFGAIMQWRMTKDLT